MIPIYVTDYLLSKHEELLPIFERAGKNDLYEREKKRIKELKEMRVHQKPIDQKLF